MPKRYPGWEHEVCALYKGGLSLNDLAEATPYSASNCRNILVKHGIPLRPVGSGGGGYRKRKRLSDDEIQKTVQLYRDYKLSLDQVSRIFGVTPNAIRWRLRLAGVPVRTRSESSRIAWEKGRRKAKSPGPKAEAFQGAS